MMLELCYHFHILGVNKKAVPEEGAKSPMCTEWRWFEKFIWKSSETFGLAALIIQM